MNPTKGNLWWKQEWISFCSAHPTYNKDCNTCQAGSWHNVWKLYLNRIIYRFIGRKYEKF